MTCGLLWILYCILTFMTNQDLDTYNLPREAIAMEDSSSPPSKRFKASPSAAAVDRKIEAKIDDGVDDPDGSSFYGDHTSCVGDAVIPHFRSNQSPVAVIPDEDIRVTDKTIWKYPQTELTAETTEQACLYPSSSSSVSLTELSYFTSPSSNSVLDSSSNDLNRYPLYCDQCLHNYKPKANVKLRDISKGRARKSRETVPDILLKNRAVSICLDCNKYLCSMCCSDHVSHVGYFVDEIDGKNHERYSSAKIVGILEEEGIEKGSELMKVEKLVVLDRIQIKHSRDKFKDLVIKGICVVNNGLHWVLADNFNKCIKVFDSRNNKMVRCIKLSSRPCGITEVPSVNSSQFSIAITVPLPDQQITIIDIGISGASITNVIQVNHEYTKIYFLCDSFVTFCEGSGTEKHFIHVLNLFGEIINVIKLHDIPGINISGESTFHLDVHKQCGYIYVGNLENGVVIQMDISGIVLNIFENPEIHPSAICVDDHQNVYIASGSRPDPVRVYRLSQGFSRLDVFLEDGVHSFDDVQAMTWYSDTFYVSHEVRTPLENTVSIIRHE